MNLCRNNNYNINHFMDTTHSGQCSLIHINRSALHMNTSPFPPPRASFRAMVVCPIFTLSVIILTPVSVIGPHFELLVES